MASVNRKSALVLIVYEKIDINRYNWTVLSATKDKSYIKVESKNYKELEGGFNFWF